MPQLVVRFLDRGQVEEASPAPDELLKVVELGLAAHGRRDVVMPPKTHLALDDRFNGHFNILTGYVPAINRAGIKVIGDFVDNWKRQLPSEIALLTLFEPLTGIPSCIMDATSLTWQRTAAVTTIGAMHLARADSRIVGHIGARGTAFSNLRLLATRFPIREVRIASKRRESRDRLAARIKSELGISAYAVGSATEAAANSDIVVEATRLSAPETLLRAGDIAPGALLVTYGWVRALDPGLPNAMDKLVVDDWEQCTRGGQLHDLIAGGSLQRRHVHAEIGEISAGLRPGRETERERILFWHRGFAVSDIMLGDWIYRSAEARGLGTVLTLGRAREE